MEIFGIKFLGLNQQNGEKFILSLVLVFGLVLIRFAVQMVARLLIHGTEEARKARFWTQQGASLLFAVLMITGLASIWFDNPDRLTTVAGLFTAGMAFALQKVITSFAGYFVILRGKTFTVGDRITMGGVRGDVVALGFIQTTIMEMGEPPSGDSSPAIWVHSRQFTGRVVTVSNSQIFDEPVYNYTRDFPYIWEEIHVPISYQADRGRAEAILQQATRNHALTSKSLKQTAALRLQQTYYIGPVDIEPTVYWRLTDNWIELAVRFLTDTHGVRQTKSAISRDIIAAFDEAGIGIASATYDVVGFPPIEIKGKV